MYKEILNEFLSDLSEIYEDLEPKQSGYQLNLSNCKELLESINNNVKYLSLQEKEREVYELLDKEWSKKYLIDIDEQENLDELEEILTIFNNELERYKSLIRTSDLS